VSQATTSWRRPRSRRGDGGQLRAEIIDAARHLLAETGGFEGLTLRGVARRVGIAATSIYLHFPDTEHLAVAATEQTFAELTAAAAAAAAGISDPGEALLARCRAYCHFGLDHPGHYRVMFNQALLPSLAANPEETPGRRAFQVLVRAVEACQTAGIAAAAGDPFRLASLVWAAEHGLVSLRLSRPQFPWADIDGLVDAAVTGIMGLRRTQADQRPTDVASGQRTRRTSPG
jgi:AcrR family transcriptional regulator